MAQTIEAFVGQSLDDAKISPLHIKVISLIAAGYFFDVIDYIVQGSLFPDMKASGLRERRRVRSGRERDHLRNVHRHRRARANSATGSAADLFTSSTFFCSACLRSSAHLPRISRCSSLAVSSPALVSARNSRWRFAYAGEYSPKRIRGRILAIIHFVGGACVWPAGHIIRARLPRSRFTGKGCGSCFGIAALIVWVLRFTSSTIAALSGDAWPGPKRRSTCSAKLNIPRSERDPHDGCCERHQERSVRRGVQACTRARVIAGMICFFGVLRRRHRAWRLAAQHHGR